MKTFSSFCRDRDVSFGVGLSPLNIFRDFNEAAKCDLARKISVLNSLQPAEFAILFDDMRGDQPDLAARQTEICHFVRAETTAARLIMCPTYYSDDPLLDRVFGKRPTNYLKDLGNRLDGEIGIFWTGEEVCSREFTTGHLRRVGDVFQRKPTLWDNYPVNDGSRSQYLHLRAFTGRPAEIGNEIAAHYANPALQPHLSLIPLLSLVESYTFGASYEYGEAFFRAASTILGEDLARAIQSDLLNFQDVGLDRLGERAERLRTRYSAFDHPAAKEIMGWLDGAYSVGAGDLPTI